MESVTKIFDFNSQIGLGANGERDFISTYRRFGASPSTDRKWDVVLANGKTVELKTDSYSMTDSPNYFMEQCTVSYGQKAPGGPWRAREHQVSFFVYYFIANGAFCWFDPITLCTALDDYIKAYQPLPKEVINDGYYGIGYTIPREAVAPVMLKQHTVNELVVERRKRQQQLLRAAFASISERKHVC